MRTTNLERIIICAFLIYPCRFFVAATQDKSRLVYTSTQERVWVNEGNLETIVGYFFYVFIVILLLIQLSKSQTNIKISPSFLTIFFLYVMGAIYNRSNWPITEIVGMSVFFLILLAVDSSSLSQALVKKLRFLQSVIVLVVILFSLIDDSRSFTKCTFEKCSISGKLLTSFFPHENALALFLFLGSILFLNKKSYYNFLMVAIHGFLVLMTGSRLVIVIFLIMLLCTLLKSLALYVAIWAISTSAAILYFTLADLNALTGRGLIFLIGRHIFFENPLFGYGFGALTDSYSNEGFINYRVSHEHNGIGAILLRHGLVGAFSFVFCLVKIGKDISRKSRLQLLLLLGLVLTFPTESASDFTLQNYSSWVYLIVFTSLVDDDRKIRKNYF